MGSRQRITDKFINDLADHYEREGAKAILRVAEENPVAYLQIICRLLPKDISLTVSNDTVSYTHLDVYKRQAFHTAFHVLKVRPAAIGRIG